MRLFISKVISTCSKAAWVIKNSLHHPTLCISPLLKYNYFSELKLAKEKTWISQTETLTSEMRV